MHLLAEEEFVLKFGLSSLRKIHQTDSSMGPIGPSEWKGNL